MGEAVGVAAGLELDAPAEPGLLDGLVGSDDMPVGNGEPELGVIELITLDPTQSMRPRTDGQMSQPPRCVMWLRRHRGVQAVLVGPAADVASLQSRGQQLGECLGCAGQRRHPEFGEDRRLGVVVRGSTLVAERQ